jgi:hypothetical protein
MKMDAMQKKRMQKVAIAHFVLSVWFGMALVNHEAEAGGIFEGSFFAWDHFTLKIFLFLQPQFLFAFHANHPMGFRFAEYNSTPSLLTLIFLLILIPLWSISFGWLYAKLTNWLNHFPVLGKKVF